MSFDIFWENLCIKRPTLLTKKEFSTTVKCLKLFLKAAYDSGVIDTIATQSANEDLTNFSKPVKQYSTDKIPDMLKRYL